MAQKDAERRGRKRKRGRRKRRRRRKERRLGGVGKCRGVVSSQHGVN